MPFIEWDLSESHDVIFGKHWFTEYNPQINWRTHEVQTPQNATVVEMDGPRFLQKLRKGDFHKIFRVRVTEPNEEAVDIPEELQPVQRELQDVFPDQLPDGMPLMRNVKFELQMKPDAVPSSRAPFRLSKVEQEALQEFVEENLRKEWIEVSNSLWVSNIFGIPKKDPATGKSPKRAEWLRSGNSKIPIRWVVDYRYANGMSIIAKIPLPHIEDLFDRTLDCVLFTPIDLA